jgi:hypothetical protein
MSDWFQRTVKNSLKLLRYQDAPNLAQFGNFGFQAFISTNGGLLKAGAGSPVQFITCAATHTSASNFSVKQLNVWHQN